MPRRRASPTQGLDAERVASAKIGGEHARALIWLRRELGGVSDGEVIRQALLLMRTSYAGGRDPAALMRETLTLRGHLDDAHDAIEAAHETASRIEEAAGLVEETGARVDESRVVGQR